MVDIHALKNIATIPEHSVDFMHAVSGGTPCIVHNYLCFAKDDWLTIIGYPLGPNAKYTHDDFLHAKNMALEKTGATTCFAIAPELPEELVPFIQEQDVYYTLSANASIPKKVQRAVEKAQNILHIEEDKIFTPKHHALWTEFLQQRTSSLPLSANIEHISSASLPLTQVISPAPMSSMVQRLFVATPTALAHPNTDIRMLNAYDAEGNLAAALLMDFAPQNFCSYLLGAHSRKHYTPHASDALFAFMLQRAREEHKSFIHLGLGVNEGITRFKRKWGAQASLPFKLASWEEKPKDTSLHSDIQTLFKELLQSQSTGIAATQKQENAALLQIMGKSKRQILASLPEQRPYAMLWKVQKNHKVSWIGGSAHFFCYSFENAFRKLFDSVDTVLFEGPLDSLSLQEVEAEGKRLTPEQQPLLPYITEQEIRNLERMVRGPEGLLARALNMEAKRLVDVRWYLTHTRPWTALFTLWTGFLERKGWQQSVDLEAWHLAHDMGKHVVAMESLEEQLASLNAVPPQRVIRYFQNCNAWPRMIRKNVQAYLQGNLEKLMGTSAEFPTRTHTIINVRDERFRRRMRPFLEQGRACVFVGTAHMLNLQHMLVEDGFTLTKVTPTLSHKLKALLQK